MQDVFMLQAETTVMSVLWNQAANLVKDVSEPLKSIVNK
jgi:predicted transcriptional regulator